MRLSTLGAKKINKLCSRAVKELTFVESFQLFGIFWNSLKALAKRTVYSR